MVRGLPWYLPDRLRVAHRGARRLPSACATLATTATAATACGRPTAAALAIPTTSAPASASATAAGPGPPSAASIPVPAAPAAVPTDSLHGRPRLSRQRLDVQRLGRLQLPSGRLGANGRECAQAGNVLPCCLQHPRPRLHAAKVAAPRAVAVSAAADAATSFRPPAANAAAVATVAATTAAAAPAAPAAEADGPAGAIRAEEELPAGCEEYA